MPGNNKSTFCSVVGCNSTPFKKPHFSFHSFPLPNKYSVYVETKLGVKEKLDAYKAWMNILKIGKPASRYMKVCSEHFTANDFYSHGM